MSHVKRIEVSGFRGILSRLEIPFQSGKAAKSMVLYGRNGTGKSSLTDAWEWLVTGKVLHLAREGAEESAYPHMKANRGGTYVQVEFANAELGTVRLTFDEKRIRSPQVSGNLELLRKFVSHPCHIRHSDLTRFVLFRKSERYDALAALMGFVPQMEYQKTLRRVENVFLADLERQKQIYVEVKRRHDTHFANREGENFSPQELLMRCCVSNNFDCDSTKEKIQIATALLRKAVINDANAIKLSIIRDIKNSAAALVPPSNVSTKIRALREAIGNLKATHSAEREKLLLIPLLQAAEQLITKVPASGKCPLCSHTYDGNLEQHVATELATLQRLNNLLAKVRTAKDSLRIALVDNCTYSPITAPEGFVLPAALVESLAQFQTKAENIRVAIVSAKDLLIFDTSDLPDELIERFKTAESVAEQSAKDFQTAKGSVVVLADELANGLINDPLRRKLVEDNEFLSGGMALIDELESAKQKGARIRALAEQLAPMIHRYAELALNDVNERFQQISEKVTLFFGILEKDTPGLGSPKLKLDSGQDRSVVLEVVFHGTAVNPAYRYLSESQLNSFGLAVALASATHFNDRFPFLILDDVVNSCDAYKRPQLIDLLQMHLSHVQVLLMTHDRFWRDLLQKRLSSWVRVDFHRYEPGVGPICKPGTNFYERVQLELDRDEAENAAGALARYLEDAAQEICEAFEVEVKFNRRNEYTLDPLLNGIRTRLEKKIGANHPIVTEMLRITQDNAYRNWGIHCKNPESPISSAEIATLVSNWKAIEAQFYCSTCAAILTHDNNRFRCGCGNTVLQKQQN